MNTKVKQSTIIHPAKETPTGSLWLSSLDLITRSPYTHTRLLYVYPSPNQTNRTNSFFDTNILKNALSKTLVHFYPMAGRLKRNEKTGRMEIDCNSKGVVFVEVETTHTLADFGEFKPTNELRSVVFPSPFDYSKGLSSFPMLMVQLTRFKCGGVSLGLLHQHQVADGTSCADLINSWARIAQGLEINVLPFHNRQQILGCRNPRQVKFRHLEYEQPLPPTRGITPGTVSTIIEAQFKLSKEQIIALKLQATLQGDTSYRLSTFQVLAAHVWRATCKARGLSDDQDVKLYIPVNGRTRLNKSSEFPKGYYGNVIFFTACVTKCADIKYKPLWYTANLVHTALKKMDNIEYLRSAIDYLESHQDLSKFTRGSHTFTCPNFTINSWVNIPFKCDFGWGDPKFFGHGGIQYEGQSYLIRSQNGDGSFSLAIKLFSDHMSLFEKYLYDFPSLLLTRL
ncbi:anthranilate N-benzoyltransferase protein 2-like [Amaranthus tricolor]|uniref:anthranilate N-benzoyltransferase protein 2-like n=1 Tax=Amaranthus tricolor TaxID=29722 RepID=UPI00258FE7C7|nr:anthranilate N-benzoyltransferase protein 2-like [Amaranthus tricolor]